VKRVHELALLVVLGAIVVRGLLVWPELPPRVASHFDGSGEADDWSSKGTFGALMLAVLALVAGVGLGILWRST
jgi:uncharacterized membrane protein